MTRPRLLDLFCGAGGCSVGYHRAGFDVVGIDINPQPSYPFEFHRTDALRVLAMFDQRMRDFDAIHASPPCKLFTNARKVHAVNRPTLFEPHPDLLTPTREMLERIGLPFVIENVPGAPLRDPKVLCGSMFGLRVRRHRLFETNWPLEAPGCRHEEQGQVVGVYGNGGAWARTAPGGGGVKVAGAEAAEALGIDWTDRQPELAQAIPPAYTEMIGNQLMTYLQEENDGSD